MVRRASILLSLLVLLPSSGVLQLAHLAAHHDHDRISAAHNEHHSCNGTEGEGHHEPEQPSSDHDHANCLMCQLLAGLVTDLPTRPAVAPAQASGSIDLVPLQVVCVVPTGRARPRAPPSSAA